MPAKTKFTKEVIIDTAFKIACNEGLDNMTIRLIAKRMGSSIAPIYVNFESIEDLKEAVLDKARIIFQKMINTSNQDDQLLSYAIASIKFSKKYPKLYNAFLLNEDHPLDSHRHVNEMINILHEDPTYRKLDDQSLMQFIISMQAFQVGLSIMARKSYYQNQLKDENLIKIIDDTGKTLLLNLLKTKETKE